MNTNELELLVKRVKRTLTPEATPIARSLELYQRFGPILFSHFYRAINDEQKAMAATRVAFERLLETGLTEDREVVAWVRGLDADAVH
ncbi:MAG: hypothetical protein IAE78_29495 [Myxococcus sp.]|nr:hypothetical protein [Myxococcus sp.]